MTRGSYRRRCLEGQLDVEVELAGLCAQDCGYVARILDVFPAEFVRRCERDIEAVRWRIRNAAAGNPQKFSFSPWLEQKHGCPVVGEIAAAKLQQGAWRPGREEAEKVEAGLIGTELPVKRRATRDVPLAATIAAAESLLRHGA